MEANVVLVEQISYNIELIGDMSHLYYRTDRDVVDISNTNSGFFLAVCFFYKKGQRPALPYPQNPSKNGN